MIGTTIIREVDYPATITCTYNDLNDSTLTFIYSDATMTTKEATIKGYRVRDMVVTKDSVFFCGTDINKSSAIIGYFSIPDVFWGAGNINIIDNISTTDHKDYATQLTRIETFLEPTGKRHIYCVGKTYSKNPCLVEKSDFNNGSYQLGILQTSKEQLTDVAIVQDENGGEHLISSGLYANSNPYIALRVYDPYNVFAPSGRQNYRYCFAIDTNNSRPWRPKDVLTTGIQKGLVTTISYRKSATNRDLTIEPFNIHVATFRTSSLLIGDLFAMIESIEIPIPPLYPNYSIKDLTPNGNGLTMAFLHHINTGDWDGDLTPFYEVDYSTTGGIIGLRKYQHANDILSGINSYNGKTQYLLSGKTAHFSSTLRYIVETFGNSETCSNPIETEYFNVQPMGAIEETEPFENKDNNSEIINPEIIRKRYPLYKECETN